MFIEEDGLGGPLLDFLRQKVEDMKDKEEDKIPDSEFKGRKLKNVAIRGVVVGSAAISSSTKFKNKRAENHCSARDWFEGEPALIKNPKLKHQLSNLLYTFTGDGGIQMLEKKLIKKEIGSSPDESDAFVTTFSKVLIPRIRFI